MCDCSILGYMSRVYINITAEFSETILLEKLGNIKAVIEISGEKEGASHY